MTAQEAFDNGYRFRCKMFDIHRAYSLAKDIIASGGCAVVVREEKREACRRDPTQFYLVYEK